MMKARSYRAYLLEQLQNVEEADAYFNAALRFDESNVFLLALQDLMDAQEYDCARLNKRSVVDVQGLS